MIDGRRVIESSSFGSELTLRLAKHASAVVVSRRLGHNINNGNLLGNWSALPNKNHQ